jgi:hypothetical protein
MIGHEVCCEIYARTKKFLYADMAKEDSRRLKEAGFQILMGPPHSDAPILFLGYQPGKGCKTAIAERKYGSEDRYPEICEYATEGWALAKRLRAIFDDFDENLLRRSVGLNAIFVRADTMAAYHANFMAPTRKKIQSFCIGCVLEIIEVVRPKKIVVVGFSTLGLFREGATWNEDLRGSKDQALTKTGQLAGRDAIAVMHLTGARISKDDRKKIADRLRTFCIS